MAPAFTTQLDAYGREIYVTDTATVRTLAAASRQGWHEIADVGYGYSAEQAPGSPAHTLALALYDQHADDAPHPTGPKGVGIWAESARVANLPFVTARELGLWAPVPSFGYVFAEQRPTTPVHWEG